MFFSIIIPFKDTLKNLSSCLNSIKKQSFLDYEVLLIDDGSKLNVKKTIKNKFKNVNIIINNVNKGVSYSRNIGIKNSSGKYLVFLDSDDVLSRDFLHNAYKKLNTCIYDFIYVDSKNLNTNKINQNSVFQRKKTNFFLRKIKSFSKFRIHSWNYIIKSSLVKKNLFINKLKFYEDQVFVSNILLNGLKSTNLKKSFILRKESNINSLGRSVGKNVIHVSIFCLNYFINVKSSERIINEFIESRIYFFLKEILKNLFFLRKLEVKKLEIKLLKIVKLERYKLFIKKKFRLVEFYNKRISNDHNSCAVIYCYGQLGRIILKKIVKKYKHLYIIDNNPLFKGKTIKNIIIYSHKDFVKKVKIRHRSTLYICHENLKIQNKIYKEFKNKKFDSMKFNFF